jgi:ammonium transporter, Amt family
MAWVLWVFNIGFGSTLKLGPGILSNFVGNPGPILGRATQDQAQIPLLNGLMHQLRGVAAACSAVVHAGLLGQRLPAVGRRLVAQRRSLGYSGGYVIHLAAGTSGFVAAAVIGLRLARDRARAIPNNLPMAAAGAGI